MIAGLTGDPFFREHLALLCDLAGEDVAARLTAEGEAYIRRNEIAAGLTLLVSATRYVQYRRDGQAPSWFAGYSVGQWAAMFAAGMISAEQMLRMVWERSTLMNRALEGVESGMTAVIGLPADQVTEACAEAGGAVWLSNINAPGQLTIAGDLAALDRAEPLLTARKAYKQVRLNVSGAWHTPLMQPAVEPFDAYLQAQVIGAPCAPVIDNVTGRPLPADRAALRTQLAAHLTQPVLWLDGVRWMAAQGAQTFLEFGAGLMLSKFGMMTERRLRHAAYQPA